ncbi:MAG: hypothetical protein NTY48_00460 [Candidatus Diapherotrites archaeon]|nr:hypothetical protein [Candidatus Diapherotrites archaeon]
MQSFRDAFELAESGKRARRLERKRAVRLRLRPFLKGKEVIVEKHSLKLLKRFIAFKEHQALKRNPFIYEFAPSERASIQSGFLWLLRGMEPKEKSARRFSEVLAEEKKCFKMNRAELLKWLRSNDITSPKQHKIFFGLVGLLINTISGPKKTILGDERVVFDAVRFPGKILFGNITSHADLGAYAVHELAHERYQFGETLCYALQNFFL